MAKENPTWGPRRVAAELYLKLGLLVSSRTVRKYWPWGRDDGRGQATSSQRWATFVRNHADAMVACDFMVAVTAKFQLLYVFVMLELGSRRILQCNVTAHPSAAWTWQPFRQGLCEETPYGFLIHDGDCIFSTELDPELVQGFGVKVLKTPPPSPQAKAFCEQRIGTIGRECLDFMIPRNEKHLRRLLFEWVRHYNAGRPHSSLGPGIPAEVHRGSVEGNTIGTDGQRKLRVISRPLLGGLHHEYVWEKRLRRQHVLFSVGTLVSQKKKLSPRISIRPTVLPELENNE